MLRVLRLIGGWALLGVAMFGAAVAGLSLIDRYFPSSAIAPSTGDVVATRFPETALPVIERARPVPIPAGLTPQMFAPAIAISGVAAPNGWSPRINGDQFLAALEAVTPLPPPARPEAVFNDTQIAAIKERLMLTRSQEPEWPPLESALRALSWERRRGVSASTLTTDSLERLRAASGGLLAKLTPRQKQEIRMLTQIVGLNVSL